MLMLCKSYRCSIFTEVAIAAFWLHYSFADQFVAIPSSPEEYFALSPTYKDPNYAQSGSFSQGLCTGTRDREAFSQAVWQLAINTYGG